MHSDQQPETMTPPVVTTLFAATGAATAVALAGVRVASPAVVLLAALSLISTKPLSPPSPSPITSVVVASRIPRRTLILILLSLSAFTFLADGLASVIYVVLNKVWLLGTGIEIASVLGLLAYAGLAALGAWKDVNGIEVWNRIRVKTAIAIALALDITQVILNFASGSLLPHFFSFLSTLFILSTFSYLLTNSLAQPTPMTFAHPLSNLVSPNFSTLSYHSPAFSHSSPFSLPSSSPLLSTFQQTASTHKLMNLRP